MAGNPDSHNGNHGVRPLLCSFIKKESTIEDDMTGSMQSIDSSEVTNPCLTKDYLKSESSFKSENMIEIDNGGLGLVNDLDFESAKEPIPGDSPLHINREDVITDHPAISVKLEATANLSDDFNRNPYGLTETSQPGISLKQIHTDTSDFSTASANGKSSSLNDESMNIIGKDSGLHTVNSKSPIIIKEELIEVDEYIDDTNNHMSSNVALQIKMEWEDTSDSETHSPRTNQSEPSSCGNENNLTTVTTISTVCKEELDLEDVQSVMVKDESRNVDEIDIKPESSLRDNYTKYSKLDNDINCDSTCDIKIQRYMCHSCPRKCSTWRGLIDHLISHHAKFVVYKCPTCELTFTTKAVQSEHSAVCKSKSQVNEPNHSLATTQFMSNKLVEVSESLVNVQGHLKTLAYRCAICTKEFKAEFSLRIHLEESVSCKRCLKVFCSLTELRIHNKVHEKDISLECSACKTQFRNKGIYKMHIKRKQITCGTCGERFCGKIKLREHKEIFGHWLADFFSCQLCSQKFDTPKKLRNHLRGSVSCGPFPRPIRTSFSRTNEPNKFSVGLKKAKGRSEGRSLRKFDCRICKSKFDSEQKLKIHIHNKPATCDACGEKFCENSDIREHKEKCWCWPRPADFSCKLCSEKFSTPTQLRIHMAEHSLSCGLCPRKFLTSSSLLNHTIRDHKDKQHEETLSAKVVNAIGTETISPTTMMNHAAEDSISCGLCPRKFQSSLDFLNHNETDHKNKQPEETLIANGVNAVRLETISCPTKMRNNSAEHSNSGGLSLRKFPTFFGVLNHNKTKHKDNLPDETLGSKGANAISLQIICCPTKMKEHTAEHSILGGLSPQKFLMSSSLLNKKDYKDKQHEESGKGVKAIGAETISCPTKLMDHSPEHSISCGLCPRKFLNSSSLLNHNETEHKNKLSEESLSAKGVNAVRLQTISCPTEMKEHTAEQSNSGGLSPQKFPTSSSLLNHSETDHKDKQHEETSGSNGANAKNLETNQTNETLCQNHVCTEQICPDFNLHTSNRIRISQLAFLFPCSFCYTRFKSSEELNSHIGTKHSFSCSLCLERFSNASDLRIHKYKTHSQMGVVDCSFCLKKIRIRNIKKHLEECKKSDGRFKCVSCDKEFRCAETLILHREKFCLRRRGVLVG